MAVNDDRRYNAATGTTTDAAGRHPAQGHFARTVLRAPRAITMRDRRSPPHRPGRRPYSATTTPITSPIRTTTRRPPAASVRSAPGRDGEPVDCGNALPPARWGGSSSPTMPRGTVGDASSSIISAGHSSAVRDGVPRVPGVVESDASTLPGKCTASSTLGMCRRRAVAGCNGRSGTAECADVDLGSPVGDRDRRGEVSTS